MNPTTTTVPSDRRHGTLERSGGEEGAALAEYALLVVLIAVVVAAILPLIGADISNIFNQLAKAF